MNELTHHEKKFSRYTSFQKYMIKRDYQNSLTVKEISIKYNASISSIYKILKDYSKDLIKSITIKSYRDKYLVLNNTEKNYIKTYIEPPQIPLSVQSISNELDKKF